MLPARLATELEKPWKPLIAMIVYGAVTIALSICARDFPKNLDDIFYSLFSSALTTSVATRR